VLDGIKRKKKKKKEGKNPLTLPIFTEPKTPA